MTAEGPLTGLLVVALEQAVAAPYASCRLADAGARVIKVERAEGDFARHYDQVVNGTSANFVWINRGKESLVLDLKAEADLSLLRSILTKADIFIQNLAVGATDRLGLGTTALKALNPKLIMCNISGYGDSNALADMKAYDLLVQGESGLASVTGGPDEPARVGVSVCDIAGGLYAYQAILESLIMRGKTGQGASIKVSLFDGMADWMTVPLLFHDYARKAPERVGLKHPSIAPYEAFQTRDGGRILIAIQNDREWQSFATDVLSRPDWVTGNGYGHNMDRVANRQRLADDIQTVFRQIDRDDLIAKLKAARIAYGAVNDIEGLSGHQALRRVRVDTPSGVALMPAPPAIIDGWEARIGAVPDLGQHSETIKKEFNG